MAVTATSNGARRDRVGRGEGWRTSLRDQVVDVLRCAHVLSPNGSGAVAEPPADHRAARGALAAAWEQAMAAMAVAVADPDAEPDAADIIPLLRRIKEADEALVRLDIEHRDALFHKVRDGLNMLSDITTTAALVARVPSAVCSLGFDRAIISRVEDSLWIPESVAVERDPGWADAILEAGRTSQVSVTGTLPEAEVVRRRVSVLVDDVQRREGVHRPIAEASLSRSYAASPIVAGGRVVGFLHADCYYVGRKLDDTDREVLATFAEGLGQALGRTIVLDRVGAVRAELDAVSGQLASPLPTGQWSPMTPPGPMPAPAGGEDRGAAGRGRSGELTPSAAFAKAELTRRELEVLRHMAAGDTNARAARRLVISEGTVKSHVKHILRKLGAANRAEAVSLWWRMENERRSGASA